MPIETLIENRDGATLVRDRIAEILATESKAQQNLALAAGKNARLYELKVTKERAAPWGSFQDAQDHYAPIINVWFDTDNFEKRLGNDRATEFAEACRQVERIAELRVRGMMTD